MPPWTQDFDAYLAEFEHGCTSFRVDLAAHAHAPVEGWAVRIQVRVKMKSPRDDGLRSGVEAEALRVVEERIIEVLEARCDAVFVGHAISEGMLHIVSYAPDDRVNEPEQLLDGLDADDYAIAWFVEHDPDWEMYCEFLFPDVRSLQIIQNRRLMRERAEHGDDPGKVRVIDHTALFDDRGAAAQASLALEDEGFEVDPIMEDGEFWVVGFHREARLDGDAVNRMCLDIIDLLEPLAGYYDGWGAPVLRSEPN